MVSRNAHNEFLDLKVNGTAQPGDEIRSGGEGPGAGQNRVEITSTDGDGRIDLVQNGAVVASQTAGVTPAARRQFSRPH